MSGKTLRFPEGFLWGTSVCSHQAEGNNVNSDWWEFEHRGKIKDGTVSGIACDMWNRYGEDFEFMQRMGWNAFRMSVEWARIEPRRGEWDAAALEHYAEMLRTLKARGISVCLTLHHFVLPKWMADAGGWVNPDSVRLFREYTRRVVDALFDYVDIWVTLNEPMGPVIGGYFIGMMPPEKINPIQGMAAFRHLLRAHGAAAEVIRRRQNEKDANRTPLIGIAAALVHLEAVDEKNLIETRILDVIRHFHNYAFLDALATGKVPFPFGTGETIHGLQGSCTYLGVNYYSRYRMARKLKWPKEMGDLLYLPPGTETTEMGYEVYPPGFHGVLMDMWERYKLPIYVTENGIADGSDTQRPRYILTHLAQVERTIRDGADIRGYFYWTFIDNFEWLEGWRPKFGLLGMKPDTLERVPRQSAYLYSEIARANAVTEEMAARYAPDAAENVFDITR